ncbi:MAG: coiled-coil domain-containing protein [Bariatricus sp.]
MTKQNETTMGTLGLEHALIQNEGRLRYDEVGKKILKHKEVLANILKYTLPEFKDYSCNEIMTFIDTDSISDAMPISPDSDTRISGQDTAKSSPTEANLAFDILFKVVRPAEKKIHLHVDVELQGNYYPPYPIEKRGIYNLSRMISSQLDVVTKKTNYNILEKAYCIFICVGNVPQKAWNTVSYYEFTNTHNIGNMVIKPSNYDLMGLILIRLGPHMTGDMTDIVKFLYGLFYDIKELAHYIDFSQNEIFRKELKNMALTGDHLIEFGQLKERERAEKEMNKMKQELEEKKQEIHGKNQEIREKEQEIHEKEQELIEVQKQLEQALQTISFLQNNSPQPHKK